MAQVQKWWELSGAGGGQKQQIQPMASGYAGKVEVLNDTTRVAILNMQGEALFEKAIAHLVSGVQTADGLDSLGNAYLWLSYTQNLGSGNMLVLEKLSSVDSIVYTPQYLHDNMASSEPIKLICSGQEAILLTAVYLPDSTSYLRWLKFDAFNGLLTDSFSTSILSNVVYSYAETFGNKAIVHGSTPQGKKNWLLDFSNASVQEWQWNFGNIALVGNETTTFTRQEDIFSVIHTYTDSTQTDALLTLCDTSFAPKWTIRYNSEYDLNDSIVDLAFYQDKIYIAGYVQKDSVNKDYLIASMNHDGTMNWELKYDGPGMESIDLGVSLCVDEVGDVFFTGHSTDNGQSRVFSIQLNEYGNVLWESDFAEAIQRRATEIVTRDGRVYLTGQNLSNSVNNFVILYKDSLKIESIQKMHLKMLATGFSVIQEDSTLKSLVWDKFSRQYSFRRTVSFSSMQKFMKKKGVDFNRLMNAKINSAFKLDKRSQTVELILASLKSRKETPFIHFPFMDSLSSVDFVRGKETNFVYSNGWPNGSGETLGCAICPNHPYPEIEVNLGSSPDVFIVNLEVDATQLLQLNRVLYSCLSERDKECFLCSDIEEPIPDLTNGGTQNHELGLLLPSDNPCTIRSDSEIERELFTSIKPAGVNIPTEDMPAWIDHNHYYNVPATTLRAYGRSKYFMRSEITNKYKSVQYPIYKANYYCDDPEACYEYGNILPLCLPLTTFKTLGLNLDGTISHNENYSYAEGGFYEIRSEFNDYPSIYFYNPIGKRIFYFQGPDLGINYNPSFNANGCTIVNTNPISENNSTTVNDLVYYGHDTFNQTAEEFQMSMISYNPSSVLQSWGHNNLFIGFSNSTQVLSSNLINVNSALSDCSQPDFEIQTVLCTLSCTPDGWFDFVLDDLNSLIQIPVNTAIKIKVLAQFEDGFTIDKCITHMLSPQNYNTQTGQPNPLTYISVSPQGRISEYLPNSANYKIIIGL